MTNVQFADSIQKEKYEYIVTNTILEVNKVLNNWYLNKKNPDYDDRLSLFRSYFAKFFKHKFGWLMYNEYIRKNYPLCLIENNKLININLNLNQAQKQRSNLSSTFDNYIKNFDFIKFNDLHPIEDVTLKTKNLNNIIDYKKIEQIKF